MHRNSFAFNEIKYEGLEWINLAPYREQWRDLTDKVMSFRAPWEWLSWTVPQKEPCFTNLKLYKLLPFQSAFPFMVTAALVAVTTSVMTSPLVVAGYVILSTFSLLTCASLVAILTLQPKPGEPLADVAGGAVCGISVLSLILAAFGVLSSRCCKYPPPDNRVEHCAEGFTLWGHVRNWEWRDIPYSR